MVWAALIIPGSRGARYEEDAPIYIEIPGGHSPGALDPPEVPSPPAVSAGAIRIQLLLPGGIAGPYSSGGHYDYPGPECQQAVADVILFAAGLGEDTSHRRITDLLPFALTDNVGIVGPRS